MLKLFLFLLAFSSSEVNSRTITQKEHREFIHFLKKEDKSIIFAFNERNKRGWLMLIASNIIWSGITVFFVIGLANKKLVSDNLSIISAFFLTMIALFILPILIGGKLLNFDNHNDWNYLQEKWEEFNAQKNRSEPSNQIKA